MGTRKVWCEYVLWIQKQTPGKFYEVQAEKFLSTKKRGALVSNAAYVSRNHPEDPAFDWFTFSQAQRTFDRTLQESIAS